jgi:hypothetical protein
MLEPGDWIGSIGRATWRDPWDWPLYRAMRTYAAARYRWPGAVVGITHVRLVLPGGLFFEATVPRARILPLSDPGADLGRKLAQGRLRIARWPGNAPNPATIAAQAQNLAGAPYDIGDLADFALTGLVGAWGWLVTRGPIRIFGDKAGRYRVCSVAAAHLLSVGGVQFPLDIRGVDPNWPFNAWHEPCPHDWCPRDVTATITPADFAGGPQ